VEVDEEAEGNVENVHVAEKLCLVNRKDLLDRFYFDEDAVLYQ